MPSERSASAARALLPFPRRQQLVRYYSFISAIQWLLRWKHHPQYNPSTHLQCRGAGWVYTLQGPGLESGEVFRRQDTTAC